VSFEFKKVIVMSRTRIQEFKGTTIEVELEVQGKPFSVNGKGVYEPCDPDLGPVLRILVSDPSGNFEFLLPESMWADCIEPSDRPGCDYRVSLTRCACCWVARKNSGAGFCNRHAFIIPAHQLGHSRCAAKYPTISPALQFDGEHCKRIGWFMHPMTSKA